MNRFSLSKKTWLVCLLPAFLLLFLYLALAKFSFGFPLDDGWIHQTYARNLAVTGRWEYVPGVVSAGSTAPLWTLWLALGYLLRLPYWVWVFASGGMCLALTGWLSARLWQMLFPHKQHITWVVVILVVSTWSLLWAAGSGMETLLFAGIALALILSYLQLLDAQSSPTPRAIALLGLLAGLLIFTRPDGLGLLLLVLVGLVWWQGGSQQGALHAGIFLVTALLTLTPYFLLNYRSSDTIFPNTFYAKQAEYLALLETNIILRYLQLLYFSLGGSASGWQGMSAPHLLLLPGWIVASWWALQSDLKARQLRLTLPLLWAGGHVLLYAWRLPVTYQHGRYLMPVYPIWIIYGLAGWHTLITHPRLAKIPIGATSAQWFVQRIGVMLLVVMWGYFLLLGGQQYGLDVDFIEGEMVNIAHWLHENTPADALIASHDIGAIGYFAERPILDLAGLISPEVIDILYDEKLVADYILQSEADYLVTAPGWAYQQAVDAGNLTPIYTTNFAWTLEQGSNNITVYPITQK